MKFKPGDLVKYTAHRRRGPSAKLALVLKVLGGPRVDQDVLIQWIQSGARTWEYMDRFEKASK